MTVGRSDVTTRELQIGADVSQDDLFAGSAKVFFGINLYDKSNENTLTDKDGRFKFENLPLGESFVTVQGNAKCPEIIPVTIGKQNKPLEVKLGPGFLIKGIVKDSDGKPLSGVKISGNRIVEPRTLRIQMTTKTNGRFYLGWIPNEQTALSVTKKGLKSHRVTLRPDKQKNNNIVIGGIKSVSGKVVDAAGKPV